MIAYLSKTQKNLVALSWFEVVQVLREANIEADALARLASGIDEEGEGSVPIEVLTRPYVSRSADTAPSWMTPLVEYLKRGTVPENKEEARKLKSLAPKYMMRGDNLFKILYAPSPMPDRGQGKESAPRGARGAVWEPRHRTIFGPEAAKAWVFLADLEKGFPRVGQKMRQVPKIYFWGYALETAAYILNQVPSKTVPGTLMNDGLAVK